MTNTQMVTAGALAAAGSDLSNAAKLTLQSTTKGYTIEAKITNGAVPESTVRLPVELRFACSNTDGVAATVAAQLALGCNRKEGLLKPGKGEVTFIATKPFIPTGSVLYVWVNSPKLPAAATVDIWANEIS